MTDLTPLYFVGVVLACAYVVECGIALVVATRITRADRKNGLPRR
jgi:hypothetical protein